VLDDALNFPPEQSFTLKTLAYMAGTLAVCLLVIVIGRTAGIFDNEPVFIVGGMLAFSGFGCWLARGRFWSAAGYFPVGIVFVIGVYGSTAGQIDGYFVLFYGLAVLLAGALKSALFTWIVLSGAVAVHLGLTSAGNPPDVILPVGITFAGCLAGILLIKTLFVRELRKALRHSESVAATLAAEIQVRRKAEADLLDREQDLRSIINQNSDGIAVTDQAGHILDWNPAMAWLTGLSKNEVLYRPLREVLENLTSGPILSPATAWPETFQRVIEGREPEDRAAQRDVCVTPREGAERITDLLMFRVSGPGGTRGVLSIRDVTTQRRLEAERQTLKQLESIGVLAGGLAHDFNNLLMGIRGNLSLVKFGAKEGRVETEALEQAEAACSRAHDLTNRLLTFAKGGAPILETFQVSDCIREAVNNVLGDSASGCKLFLAEKLPEVRADRSQLRQAIENVIRNAVQATSGTDSVGIKASRADIGSGSELPLPAGVYIVISVSDRGPGIPEEIRARIFDPYFTTKAGADGLGLATTHSILRRHRGLIRLDSRPGRGATFHLYIPAESLSAAAPQPSRSSPGKAKRILLLDDDPAIRDVAAKMLQRTGYDAVTVADGPEALRVYSEAHSQGTPFDLVIMDLTIVGGIDGVETLRLIRERFPEVTAVVSSGYSTDPVMASFADYGFSGVIVKPYTMEEMAEVLAGLLHTEDPQ